MTQTEARCLLYVAIEAGPNAVALLTAALSAGDVASCLIAPLQGSPLEARAVKPMVDLCQQRGVAALIADDAAVARKVRADGVHLSSAAGSAEAYAAARGVVGEGAIVGVDAAISRHDAMTLAEAGADYVAFGAPARLHDRDKARARRDDLVAWWAEIFQVPCVAFDVENPREAEALARAGADFVAVTLTADCPTAKASALIAEIDAAIRVGALAH